jgi:superoxide dismutase
MHKSCEIDLKQFAGDYMPVFSERSVKMHIEIIHNTYLQEVNKICNVSKTLLCFQLFSGR